ncbi:hypothetical protein C2R22_17490 [Salinigranum rubrum]|uniref:Uncharacterized protein n=1 Tax=Salinigranum rubrum TaxID=755307 RepID=A0A2I8VMU8_9EURY|nr:hypothetical protein [Salinigranum rubrum]AUV83215.1 hypothetical protein C2R22_17490 [Salinigranum rubrum]
MTATRRSLFRPYLVAVVDSLLVFTVAYDVGIQITPLLLLVFAAFFIGIVPLVGDALSTSPPARVDRS